MAGLSAFLAGLLTLWGALRRQKGGSEFLTRILSLAPLLLILGALLSTGGEVFYHFSLRGGRFDLGDGARALVHLGGKPPESEELTAPDAPKDQDEPYLAFGEFVASGAGGARLFFDPKEGLSLVCEPGDMVAGLGAFNPETLAGDTPRFCHVVPLQDGDEIRLASSGNILSYPVSLSSGSLPRISGCPLVDAGGLRALRAFSLLDALNQITEDGCRTPVAPRPEEDESAWRFRLGTSIQGDRLLLPFKSYLFWPKGDPSRAYLAVLDPGVSVVRGGVEVPVPERIEVRKVPSAREGEEATALANSLAKDPAQIVLVHRFHSRRFEAYPQGCGQGEGSSLCAFFRVDLKERALVLRGEEDVENASVVRLELLEPAFVPVRDEALRTGEKTRRPVLFVSGWGGALNREEAQTTLLFPHQVGGFGPLRVRFDVGEDGIQVTAPNASSTYGESALLPVGARKNQLLLGFTRHEAPWFLLWLFAALLLGRAFLLPSSFFGPRFPRAALLVSSYLLALRALFGLKAYILFPVDRESFELAILGATLVPAVIVSAIALGRHLARREGETSGPWGVALGHALMSLAAASAYYQGLSAQSRLIFFLLGGASLGLALLAPLLSLAGKFLKQVPLSHLLERAPQALKRPWVGPLSLVAALFLVRLGLAAAGMKEAAILGGNRVPFSIFHVPVAYAALAWLASVEARAEGFGAKYHLLTLLALVVLFPVVAGLTSDWGLMLLGLPPALLVLGARRVKLARVALVLLAGLVGIPKLFGSLLAPVVFEVTGPDRFNLSNGAYRLLLTLDPDSIDQIGSIGSDRVAEHAAIIRRYAQGKSGGAAAILGDGYLADDIKPYGPAVVQTLLTDGATATFLMPEFGILGVAGVLLALGGLLGALRPAKEEEAGQVLPTVRAMMAAYTAFAGFYMIAAPTSLVFFTGKNFPFLSIISKSDLLESGLFLILAGLFLPREEEVAPSAPARKEDDHEDDEGEEEEDEEFRRAVGSGASTKKVLEFE